jgi:hypothetical protein
MAEQYGPFHRTGAPGGPGARVASLPIQGRAPGGELEDAELLDAEDGATEVEMLRTICHGLGITWGQDDLGWWAAVPSSLRRA